MILATFGSLICKYVFSYYFHCRMELPCCVIKNVWLHAQWNMQPNCYIQQPIFSELETLFFIVCGWFTSSVIQYLLLFPHVPPLKMNFKAWYFANLFAMSLLEACRNQKSSIQKLVLKYTTIHLCIYICNENICCLRSH